MDYLVFRLYGPLASWGEIAVGESRHSSPYPGKSALIGLLGAALGINREDDDAQQALAQGYQFAVKMVSSGQVLRDYHTTQAPDSTGKFRYRTRRDELTVGKARLGTVLSSREYRTDSLAVVALAAKNDARWSLKELAQAVKTPKFHLYLGRKSCPLAAPLDPQFIVAAGFRLALDNYQLGALLMELPKWDSEQRWLPSDTVCRYYWEGNSEDFAVDGDDFSQRDVQMLTRHDQPLSRRRWQFQPRRENLWICREGG